MTVHNICFHYRTTETAYWGARKCTVEEKQMLHGA